jgi:hypothetical protein
LHHLSEVHTTPSGSKDFTWSFSFSDNEIEEITKIHHENNKEKEFIFAFICGQKQLSDYNQIIEHGACHLSNTYQAFVSDLLECPASACWERQHNKH